MTIQKRYRKSHCRSSFLISSTISLITLCPANLCLSPYRLCFCHSHEEPDIAPWRETGPFFPPPHLFQSKHVQTFWFLYKDTGTNTCRCVFALCVSANSGPESVLSPHIIDYLLSLWAQKSQWHVLFCFVLNYDLSHLAIEQNNLFQCVTLEDI